MLFSEIIVVCPVMRNKNTTCAKNEDALNVKADGTCGKNIVLKG
jgi:hypothetical protein